MENNTIHAKKVIIEAGLDKLTKLEKEKVILYLEQMAENANKTYQEKG